MKAIQAKLKISIPETGKQQEHAGELSIINPMTAKLKLSSPMSISDKKSSILMLSPKYPGFSFGAFVLGSLSVNFWIGDQSEGGIEHGTGLLDYYGEKLVENRLRQKLISKASILACWIVLMSTALYGGFHYHIVHGTVVSQLPILSIATSLLLTFFFLLSVVAWGAGLSNGLRLFPAIFLRSGKYIIFLFCVIAPLTLFQLPSIGLIAAANAWMDFSKEIRISGPIAEIAPGFLTVKFHSRFTHEAFSFYVVSVHNSIDQKLYTIDIPKKVFEKKKLKTQSYWEDEIHPGAFGVPYRVGWISNTGINRR